MIDTALVSNWFIFTLVHQCTKLAVDNYTVSTPTLYYHYTPHYTRKVMDIHVG